jgi:hypothetical protein
VSTQCWWQVQAQIFPDPVTNGPVASGYMPGGGPVKQLWWLPGDQEGGEEEKELFPLVCL